MLGIPGMPVAQDLAIITHLLMKSLQDLDDHQTIFVTCIPGDCV